jgi:hypothetical protein
MAARRFTILDAMILVAATALGFWLARSKILHDAAVSPRTGRYPWQTWSAASFLVIEGVTLGVVAIRLLPPRPPLRRLARQPGFLAVFTVAMNLAAGTAVVARDWLNVPNSGPGLLEWLGMYLHFPGVYLSVAFAVTLAWAIGGLQGLRWTRPDWIERAGRWLGIAWLIYWLFALNLIPWE